MVNPETASLPHQTHSELLATSIVFVNSANREIVKSALGFVKVAIITLSLTVLRPQLSDVVPALLGWSHDHKNHFKTKVVHIFERLARRVGWEEIIRCADAAAQAEGEGGERLKDGRAVLEGLKKRKDKAKRKKAKTHAAREDDEDDESEVSDFL